MYLNYAFFTNSVWIPLIPVLLYYNHFSVLQNPQGPPPPYPGSSSGAVGSNLGPPHGHGKKGKNRKGHNLEMGRIW